MPITSKWTHPVVVSADVPVGKAKETGLPKSGKIGLYKVGEPGSPTNVDLRNMYRRRITGISSRTSLPAEDEPTTTTTTTRRSARATTRPTSQAK
jgi:hypothetical protein